MNKPNVSILVPICNVEKFLDKCLQSLINQSLHDIEIICINDGSKDNSSSIIKKYADLDRRIVVIEKMLRNAEVIDDDEVSGDMITVGSKVRILDVEFDEEIEYTIVGSAEADPMNSENGRISNESPVGRGLLGHRTGDVVAIETPGGIAEFKVLAISR